jgi:hypothetical protein
VSSAAASGEPPYCLITSVDPAPAESQALANCFKADASMKGDPYEEQHYPPHTNLYVAVLIAWRSAEAQ